MQRSNEYTRNASLVLGAIIIGASISYLDWRGLVLWLGLGTLLMLIVHSELGMLLGVALTAFSRFLVIGINLQPADFAFLVFGAFWIVQRFYQERPLSFKPEPGITCLLIGAVAILFSFFVTSSFGISLGSYIQLIYLVILTTLLVAMFDDKEFLYAAIWTLVLAAGGISVYGVLGYFRGGARVIGTFDNPNVYSSYVIAAIPLAWFLIKKIRKRFGKVFISGLIMFMAIGLLLSLSRKGWLALAVQIFYLAVCSKKRKLFMGVLISILTIVIILLPLINTILPEQVIDRALAFTRDSSTVNSRLNLFKISFDLIRSHPLFGVGLEMFPWYAPLNSHSTWIGLWAEVGLVGVLPFIAALGIISMGFLYRSFKTNNRDNMINAIAASFFGLFFISQFGNIVFFRHYWIIIAMSVSVLSHSEYRKVKSNER